MAETSRAGDRTVLGGIVPPELTPEERAANEKAAATRYWRRITDEVLERCRKDEAYRREVLASVKAAGTGKRGARGLPDWAPGWIVDEVKEMQRTYVRVADGKRVTVDEALYWLRKVFEPEYGTKVATMKNLYNAEVRRRRMYR